MCFGRLMRDSCELVVPRADASWRAQRRPLGRHRATRWQAPGGRRKPAATGRPQESAGLRAGVEQKQIARLARNHKRATAGHRCQPWELAGVWPGFPVPPGFKRVTALKKNGASVCTQINRKFRRTLYFGQIFGASPEPTSRSLDEPRTGRTRSGEAGQLHAGAEQAGVHD